jgi:hypothetical protein
MRRRFMLSRSKIEPLFFEALENGFYFTFTHECEYCLNDDYEWVTLSANTMSPTINIGEKIYVRANRLPSAMTGVGTFGITKSCNLGGNPISLVASNQLLENSFQELFRNCSGIIDASQLQLPTTLTKGCFLYMFYGCTNLTSAPELPATTLVEYCYAYMFYGCIKLNYIKMLATDVSANSCLYYWVYGVASSGTFVKNPAMTSLPTGISGIPSGWTVVNDGEESGGGI